MQVNLLQNSPIVCKESLGGQQSLLPPKYDFTYKKDWVLMSTATGLIQISPEPRDALGLPDSTHTMPPSGETYS